MAQNSGEHTVKQGETLYSIARQYDITVSDLREWNDLGDNPTLSIGQILRLVPPVTKDAVKHIVQQGETLFAISRKYDVTIAEIQQWNNIQSPELSIGMELMLYPGDSSAEAALPTENRNLIDAERTSLLDDASTRSTGYYIVRSGDSLSKIAREHNMTVDELKRLNNLQNDLIRVGQQLTVRESISAPSVADAGDNLESSPQGKFVNYTVSSGETLSDILTNFEMTKEELAALNPGAEISEINRGQRLTVLLPPVRYFANPYKKRSGQQNLGMINALKYPENNFAGTTTSGELYNPEQLTAAHSNMALGTVVYVENPENKRGVFVKINDRFSGDGIKLSEKAFDMLKFSKTDTPVVSIYQD
ncbi:MAG: LysM peptidoglycan-binding domain-containing protein [Balneolaceae bacterium]